MIGKPYTNYVIYILEIPCPVLKTLNTLLKLIE